MRAAAIIQARMGSTRLPGKVLMPLAGRPMVAHVLQRAASIRGVGEVILATSTNPEDDALAQWAAAQGWTCHRGSAEDVLARFHGAAGRTAADAILRITADCPMLCPEVSARVLDRLAQGGSDYVSNVVRRTFPRGLDTEAFTRRALDIAAAEAVSARDREHVTPFIWSQPQRFRIAGVEDAIDRSRWRWTVDTPEDLDLAQRLHAALPAGFGYADLIQAMQANPDWERINAAIAQKTL